MGRWARGVQLVMVTPRPVTHHCTASLTVRSEDAHIQCRQSSSVLVHTSSITPLPTVKLHTTQTIPPVEWILYISPIWWGIPDLCLVTWPHSFICPDLCSSSWAGLGWAGLDVSSPCWLQLCSTALTLRYPGQRAVTVHIISSQREALRNN